MTGLIRSTLPACLVFHALSSVFDLHLNATSELGGWVGVGQQVVFVIGRTAKATLFYAATELVKERGLKMVQHRCA